MPLEKVPFASGFHTEGTDYSAGPSWVGGDKVRFRKGKPEQIGGWETQPISVFFPDNNTAGQETATYRGVCRSLYDWGTAAGNKYLGIGTNLKFYVEIGGQFSDITPLRLTTTTGTTTFSAVSNGSSQLIVHHTSHGAVVGDHVTFSDAGGLGGAITADVLNHEYQIDSLIDTDSYYITAREVDGTEVLATAADVSGSPGGGANTVAKYQINAGTNNYIAAVGYGVGTYGGTATGTDPAVGWGGGSAIGFSNQLRLYSQDAFADDLIFNARGGGIFFWDESDGVTFRAENIDQLPGASNCPIIALQVMVSPVDRHVIAFGSNALGDDDPATAVADPLLVRWSDQESVTVWTPTATNSAGGQVLSSGTRIVGAVRTRQEILIFTDTSITAMRYSGAPFVYQFSPIAENVSMISPKAAIPAGDAVYFMDDEGFYIYQGAVRPLSCDVLAEVFDVLNKEQAYKIFAATNTDKSEVTWFYPIGTGTTEITNYVTYNYLDGLWTTGTFMRGAWVQAQTRVTPIAASNNVENVNENILYLQEYGLNGDGQEIGSYILSGHAEIGDGESLMFIDRMISDFEFIGTTGNADMSVTILGNKYPMQEMTVRSTSAVTDTTGQSNVRVRARGIQLKIEANGVGYGWRMGDFRFDMRTDGRR